MQKPDEKLQDNRVIHGKGRTNPRHKVENLIARYRIAVKCTRASDSRNGKTFQFCKYWVKMRISTGTR